MYYLDAIRSYQLRSAQQRHGSGGETGVTASAALTSCLGEKWVTTWP